VKSRACPSFLLLLLVLPAAGHAGEAASAPAAEPELPRLVLEPVYALKEVDQAPTPISRQDATYPRTLRTRRIEGSVVVGFTINSKGTVLDAHAVSSTNEGFEQAAIDAVKKWRFKPGMKDGKPVSTKVEVTLTFSLKSL
jgi:TonB family protein